MKKIKLGKSDILISQIGLGTWSIGGGPAWGGDKDKDECLRTIRKAPELGVNLIDTAPGYNFGASEKIVGEALQKMDRAKVVIITKCGIVWERKGSLFNKVGDRQLYKNLSKESIMEEIDKSLERLGLDHIDVYMTHWQAVEPYFTPISETMEALNELKAQGKIKAIGAANISPEQIKEYVKYGELDIVQGKYSVLDRAVEETLFPICQKYGYAITGIKCREAILESEDGFTSTTSIPRDKLIRTQTPQTFRLGNLIAAHEEAMAKGIANSVASCTLMAELGGRQMHVVPGSEKNIKITTIEDLEILKALMKVQPESWLK